VCGDDVMLMCPAVHEKIFVVFMVMAVLYELVTLVVFKWAHRDLHSQPHVSTVLILLLLFLQ